jgi:hypothetical protein
MKLGELASRKNTGLYDEPKVKERRLFWRCLVPLCGRVAAYVRTSKPNKRSRLRCIHCGGKVDTANFYLISICKACRRAQTGARKLLARRNDYKPKAKRQIRFGSS